MELDLSPKVRKALKFEVVELSMFENKLDFLEYCKEIGANGNHEGLWNLLQFEPYSIKVFFFA